MVYSGFLCLVLDWPVSNASGIWKRMWNSLGCPVPSVLTPRHPNNCQDTYYKYCPFCCIAGPKALWTLWRIWPTASELPSLSPSFLKDCSLHRPLPNSCSGYMASLCHHLWQWFHVSMFKSVGWSTIIILLPDRLCSLIPPFIMLSSSNQPSSPAPVALTIKSACFLGYLVMLPLVLLQYFPAWYPFWHSVSWLTGICLPTLQPACFSLAL